MNRELALEQLGLSSQDWGPCFSNEFTHAQFAAAWRGIQPCPSESAINTAKKTAAVTLKIRATKVEANKRIIAIVPGATVANVIIKELNLLMQGVSLLDKKLRNLILTAAEETQMTQYRTIKDKVDAIRAASDLVEADIQASADPASFDVVNSARWPV